MALTLTILFWKAAFSFSLIMSRALINYICIGNSMICSDNGHKYHEWYFSLRQFWNITSGIYAKYHVQIRVLFVYTTTHKRFVIFTCGYFKLSWNTTALSQSNCRNFSCRRITVEHHLLATPFLLSKTTFWSLQFTVSSLHLYDDWKLFKVHEWEFKWCVCTRHIIGSHIIFAIS